MDEQAERTEQEAVEEAEQSSAADVATPEHGEVADMGVTQDAELPPETDDTAEDAEDVEDAEGFWEAFRKRMISWRTMNRPLRLITGLGVAQLLAAGLFIALHQLPPWTIPMGAQAGRAKVMPAPFFWAGLLFFAVSLSFIMAGALRMRWPVRLVALAGLTWLTLYPPTTPAYAVYRWSLLAALWLWAGLAALIEDPRRLGPLARWLDPVARRLRAALPGATLVFLFVWQVALLLPLLALSNWLRDPSVMIFQLSVELQLEFLAFALAPALFLAGSDFAEIGAMISSAIARATAWRRLAAGRGAGWLALGVTTTFAVAILAYTWPRYRAPANNALAYLGALLLAGVAALALGGLLRLGRAGTWPRTPVSGVVLSLAALAYVALTWGGVTAALASSTTASTAAIAGYDVYHSPAGAPTFSIPYPQGWKQSFTQSGSQQAGTEQALATFNGSDQPFPGLLFVAALQRPNADAASAAADLTDAISHLKTSGRVMTLGSSGVDGSWLTQRATFIDPSGQHDALIATGWSRAQGGVDWLVIGFSPAIYQDQMRPVYAAIAHGWRPDASAQAPDISYGYSQADTYRAAALFYGLIPLLLGLALGALFIWWGRTRHPALRVAGVFAAAMGLYVGLTGLPVMLSVIGAPASALWFLALDLPTLQRAVALATLALVVWVVSRRRQDARWIDLTRLALTLNAGLLFIALMIQLYGWAIDQGNGSTGQPLNAAEGLIVIIALGWDLLMSGVTFTNGDSSRTPRGARVLLYIGYITLTATLVMFFSSQHYAPGAPPPPKGAEFRAFFESEPWPQQGVELLGVPLVVTVFALALAAWMGARRRAPATLAEDSGAALPAAAESPSA